MCLGVPVCGKVFECMWMCMCEWVLVGESVCARRLKVCQCVSVGEQVTECV